MNRKTFAVTGVASGIGAALANLLKSNGHRVIGLDIVESSANLDSYVSLDLADTQSINAAANAIDEPLDGLCNIAGLSPRPGREATLLQVNFLSQRLLTRTLLPRLNANGSIVNMASRAGHGWRDNLDQIKRLSAIEDFRDLDAFVQHEQITPTRAYNLSKEAMILWTVAETEPLIARNIRMNSVSPGAVATGILDDFANAFGEQMQRNVARAGRPGSAEEVAHIAAFLLSPDSQWLKGVDIPVDGGMGAFTMTDRLSLASLQMQL